MKKYLNWSLEDFVEQQQNQGYNFFRTMGWVVILKNNKPVNYYADHGELDKDYLCEDKIFSVLAEELKDNLTIVDVIVQFNNLRGDIWNKHTITI